MDEVWCRASVEGKMFRMRKLITRWLTYVLTHCSSYRQNKSWRSPLALRSVCIQYASLQSWCCRTEYRFSLTTAHVAYMFFLMTSYPYFSTCWASFASCFRRRGHGSLPAERPTGMPCQPPQPAAQMHVFPDSVPMEDILPVYNDFGAPLHYLGHEWDTDESLGHSSSHKDLRAPPPSYQGL
ncbi:hypothetical protein EV401DRAFT_1978464 [Pisolithus croceorrhizus]|nr:hypothetical protein EV401DRAFT_1978464 [Pisolithus croceorrhizus]